MERLLILTCFSLWLLLIKLLRVRVTQWSFIITVIGGISILVTLMSGMAVFHPVSSVAGFYTITTPIVSNVQEKVAQMQDKTVFAAGYALQSMQNIKVGNDAEVIFSGIPGRTFAAHVTHVIPAMVEDQLFQDGRIMRENSQSPGGVVPVFLEFDQDMSGYFLPVGCVGTAVVYSEHWRYSVILRKILLRMRSWLNFVRWY